MDLIKDLVDYFSSNGQIVLDGVKVRVKDDSGVRAFTQKEFQTYLGDLVMEKGRQEFWPLFKDYAETFPLLKTYLKDYQEKLKLDKVAIIVEGFEPQSLSELESYIPAYDLEGKKYILVDPENKSVVFDNCDVIFDKLDHASQKEKRKVAPFVKVIYDPYLSRNLEKINYKDTKLETHEVTSYSAPKYRSFIKNYGDDINQIFVDFFIHLFPDEKDRFYVFDWVHFLLTTRNQTYLLLTGAQGTGKTTFAELLAELVGIENYHIAKLDFAKARFNAFLDKRQLVVLDEFECKKSEQKSVLKNVINDVVAVEAKNVDQYNIINKCSFLILNNSTSGIWLEPFDRRFSVPKVTSEKLLEAKGLEWITRIKQAIKEEEHLAKLYNFFLNWTPKSNVNEPWKPPYFYEVVKKSSRPAFQFLIKEFTYSQTEKVHYQNLRETYLEKNKFLEKRPYFPTVEEIISFFESYKQNEEYLIDDYGEEKGNTYFILKTKFETFEG